MIQSFDGVTEKFLASFSLLTKRMANTQTQISSGLRVSKASDDPSAIGDIVQLQSNLGRMTQVTTNLQSVQGEASTSESALESATSLLQRAVAIASQGGSGTQTANSRAALAQEMQQILNQMVSISRTNYQGGYLFSGDAASAPQYDLNLSAPSGVTRLSTAGTTRLIEDAGGFRFAVSKTAGEIFDHRNPDDSPATDNVFNALNTLRLALTNNDPAGVAATVDSLHSAQNYLSQQLAFYGAVQSHIANSLDMAQKFQTQYQTSLSQERDTDIAAASTELAQVQLSQQASIQAQAATPKTSLFDFLK